MTSFPELPYESWLPTKETLHRFLQVVGKLRLASSPRRNHWWNVPFHLTGAGVTTRPMGSTPIFDVDFDFIDHRLVVATVDSNRGSFSLLGHSVATLPLSFSMAHMRVLCPESRQSGDAALVLSRTRAPLCHL